MFHGGCWLGGLTFHETPFPYHMADPLFFFCPVLRVVTNDLGLLYQFSKVTREINPQLNSSNPLKNESYHLLKVIGGELINCLSATVALYGLPRPPKIDKKAVKLGNSDQLRQFINKRCHHFRFLFNIAYNKFYIFFRTSTKFNS